MKKRLFIALVLMLCIGVTGCISLQSADAEPTITPDQIATSAPEQTAEETSAPEELEYTYITLSMTKAEAIDYFRPLLEKDADFFKLDDNLAYVPLEIHGAYPDVTSFASLYSRYTQQTEANISVITVNLYTPATTKRCW